MSQEPISIEQARLRQINPVTGDGAVDFLATTPPDIVDKLYGLSGSETLAGTVGRMYPGEIPADVVEHEQAERWLRIQEAQERLSKVPGRIIQATGMLAVAGSTYLGLDRVLIGQSEVISDQTEMIATTVLVVGTTAVASTSYVVSGASRSVKARIAKQRATRMVSN